MASDARIVADAVAVHLLGAVNESGIGPGVAVDIARRIADAAAFGGVNLDDLAPLIAVAEGRL
jgi:hypothetical protein